MRKTKHSASDKKSGNKVKSRDTNTDQMPKADAKPRPPKAKATPPSAPQGAEAKKDKPQAPPPGLDPAKHAASQQAAENAEVLGKLAFPTLMCRALGWNDLLKVPDYVTFLKHFIEKAGDPEDPVERMMLEQLAFAHFRVGQLHDLAGNAKSTESAKIYNSATARLLGEFRRTALALRAYRMPKPESAEKKNVKLFKMAQ